MSSLAATALSRGYMVSGSDRSRTPLTENLERMGAKIYYSHSAENLGGDISSLTVIYTAAISPDNPELSAAAKGGAELLTRAEFLGRVMLEYPVRIGIAGTHGKSTTTAMTALIFEESGLDPTVIDGAVMKEYDSAYKNGSGNAFIFEACEYTDSFLSFFPTTAAVTNVDFDHADYFHSREQYISSFVKYMGIGDRAVINLDSVNSPLCAGQYKGKLITCSIKPETEADYKAENITFCGGCARYDMVYHGETLTRITLSVPGLHNVSDSLTASAAAIENGCTPEACSKALVKFRGIKRRFELIGTYKDNIRLFDDYAHHPEEIRATLSAAKGMGGRIICVYQPHSVSRTVELFEDFVKSFDDCGMVIFADIYENLEHDTGAAGLTSADLSARVKNSEYIPSFDDIVKRVKETARSGDIIITMGAGSIFRVCERLAGELAE